MGGFRFLEHTADVKIEAEGETLEKAFEEAAKALYELMTDTSKIEPKVERKIEIEGKDLESLLYNWLEEFIYLTDSEGLVFSEINVKAIRKEGDDLYKLVATANGEKFNPRKHVSKTDVKAATYHEMEIDVKKNKVRLVFVLDI
ncbi:MAG: archease [Candidatus Freyarchaeota archaeon]|nr:archease [Candidatus Jordarchaeia archaeon]